MKKQIAKIHNQNAVHYIIFSVVQDIDIFTVSEYVNMLIDNIKYCQANKNLQIHSWCIMPNRVYLLVSVLPNNSLSDVIRDLKKYSSVTITKAIDKNVKDKRKNWIMWIFKSAGERNTRNENVQFWQQDNQPFEISTATNFEKCVNYVHNIPVKAGLVFCPEGYRYSSAVDYATDCNQKGLIEITYN